MFFFYRLTGGQGNYQDVNCLSLDSYWDVYVQSTGHYHSWTQKPIVSDARKGNKESMFSSWKKDESGHVANVLHLLLEEPKESRAEHSNSKIKMSTFDAAQSKFTQSLVDKTVSNLSY